MAYSGPNPAEGVVSLVNSSVANLAASAVFTGTSEDVSIYSNIKITIYSSHVSATNGLSFQQSHDGVLWFPLTDTYTIPALIQRPFSIPVNMKFFRVVYTNGATLTTQLIIQTIYHKSDKQPSSVKPQDSRSNENDFVEILSYLMGYNSASDSWDRLRSTTAKGLDVNPTELRAATLAVTVTAATGVAATLSIPAVAGLFHYITSIEVRLYSTAARTGVAAPILVTTTNIPGTPSLTFDTAGAIGTSLVQQPFAGATPLKSLTVNTATTIVAPLVTGGIWRMTATYFTAA